MICGSAGSKSRLGKAAGAEVAVWRNEKLQHAAVARSTFASQHVKKLTVSNHFLKRTNRPSRPRLSELASKDASVCEAAASFEHSNLSCRGLSPTAFFLFAEHLLWK